MLGIGVPGGDELLAFAEAVIAPDRAALDKARTALAETLAPPAIPAPPAPPEIYPKHDRIANGCGIPVDPLVLKATKDIREQLGLNDFRSAENTFRHYTG